VHVKFNMKTTEYKVYGEFGEYLGSMKYPEDALVIADRSRGTVRLGRSMSRILWNARKDFAKSEEKACDLIWERGINYLAG
jgi:hypothetical protein